MSGAGRQATSRLFVALVPPQSALADLTAWLAPEQRSVGPVRWTPRNQWHLTLVFMPAVAPDAVPEVEQRLEEAVTGFDAPRLTIAGVGAFPRARRARVLWTGVQGVTPQDDEQLQRLAARTRGTLSRYAAGGDRPFRAHLTIGRTRQPSDVRRLLAELAGHTGRAWPASDLRLIESELGASNDGRSRHTVRAAFTLGSESPLGSDT